MWNFRLLLWSNKFGRLRLSSPPPPSPLLSACLLSRYKYCCREMSVRQTAVHLLLVTPSAYVFPDSIFNSNWTVAVEMSTGSVTCIIFHFCLFLSTFTFEISRICYFNVPVWKALDEVEDESFFTLIKGRPLSVITPL